MGEARLGVDVGGTFTDLVALVEGRLITAKVPTTPRNQARGVVSALELVQPAAGVVASFAHGSTVATNGRRGAGRLRQLDHHDLLRAAGELKLVAIAGGRRGAAHEPPRA